MDWGALGAAHQLEHGVLGAVALARHDAGAAHQPRGQIVHDVPVQVGHHQHVELVGVLHQLGWGNDGDIGNNGNGEVWSTWEKLRGSLKWGWMSSKVSPVQIVFGTTAWSSSDGIWGGFRDVMGSFFGDKKGFLGVYGEF